MISSIATILLCTFAAQSGDQTVLSTAERFFYQNEFQQSAEMIDSNIWSDNSLWSRAGLIRELCNGGWRIECPVMPAGDFAPFNSTVTVSLHGEFPMDARDSVRVLLPVPAELPWQILSVSPEITVSGVLVPADTRQGWLFLEGIANRDGDREGKFEVTVSQQVSVTPPACFDADAPGSDEAMVPFPGEDSFLDSCLSTDVFWTGGDVVYLESAILAAGEPNPMRLVERIINTVSVFYNSSTPVTDRTLLYPVSEEALEERLLNSAGGASLGAAVLRRWQIPALVIPGFTGSTSSPGFLLATYVKPFDWMVISPYPGGFTAFGSFDPPPMKSWFNGLPGITFQAEYLGTDGFWHAVPFDSPEFVHTVEITTE